MIRCSLLLRNGQILWIDDLREAKVAQFVDALLVPEDVCRLDVSVHDVAIMAVFQAKADLRAHIDELFFSEFSVVALVLNHLHVQVASICKLHHDVELEVHRFVHVAKLNNVRMVELLKYARLLCRSAPGVCIQLLHIYALDYPLCSIQLALDQVALALLALR